MEYTKSGDKEGEERGVIPETLSLFFEKNTSAHMAKSLEWRGAR